jgi:hypothetical protein
VREGWLVVWKSVNVVSKDFGEGQSSSVALPYYD